MCVPILFKRLVASGTVALRDPLLSRFAESRDWSRLNFSNEKTPIVLSRFPRFPSRS